MRSIQKEKKIGEKNVDCPVQATSKEAIIACSDPGRSFPDELLLDIRSRIQALRKRAHPAALLAVETLLAKAQSEEAESRETSFLKVSLRLDAIETLFGPGFYDPSQLGKKWEAEGSESVDKTPALTPEPSGPTNFPTDFLSLKKEKSPPSPDDDLKPLNPLKPFKPLKSKSPRSPYTRFEKAYKKMKGEKSILQPGSDDPCSIDTHDLNHKNIPLEGAYNPQAIAVHFLEKIRALSPQYAAATFAELKLYSSLLELSPEAKILKKNRDLRRGRL